MRSEVAILCVTALLMCACSTIDCPLNNTVYSTYSLRNAEQKVDTLGDTLTVWTHRAGTVEDTLLLYRAEKATAFTLPMSYGGERDSLFIDLLGENDTHTYDTIVVSKTNEPHFESTDCAPSFFQTVTAVSHTNNAIDSIIIVNNYVTNVENETHFNIYFNPRH